MTSPPDPRRIPDWVQGFLESPTFTTAVDKSVQSLKSSVDQQVSGLQKQVDKIKADADAAFSRNWQAQVPISASKEEIAGLNAAVNGIKAEFNVFDPIKIFGIQDKYDDWLLSKMHLLRKKMGVGDRKPEKPLTQEEITKDEIKRAKNRLAAIEEALRSPATLSSLHKAVGTNRRWTEDQFKQLKGAKHPPKNPPKGRRSDAIPSVRQLERQEQQLRNTIKQFVGVVKGAIPESAAFAKEMARIEQQLK
ncbi:hypothetical protein [Streptomyces griseorubiginosus]|uniref:hypothetical protein n=1 Tax=Streptomyces griseorubiginosus TaxID=67304 RepID=UPI003656AFCB